MERHDPNEVPARLIRTSYTSCIAGTVSLRKMPHGASKSRLRRTLTPLSNVPDTDPNPASPTMPF